jgi:hypothetical protein
MLANINFIGELFKVGIISSMIMHYCITTLLDKKNIAAPDEEKIELLCKLLMSIGDRLDVPPVENTKRMDGYAAMLDNLSRNTTHLSHKVRVRGGYCCCCLCFLLLLSLMVCVWISVPPCSPSTFAMCLRACFRSTYAVGLPHNRCVLFCCCGVGRDACIGQGIERGKRRGCTHCHLRC